MFRLFTLFLIASTLTGCFQTRAVPPPYFNGSFVGYYLTSPEAMPIGIRLELTASGIEQKRYTIAGTATLGEATFTAEGYELAADNLDYLAPQAPPPPRGDAFIEFKNESGTTMYTLCTGLYYSEETYNLPLVDRMFLIDGAPQSDLDPAYCSNSYDPSFGSVELTKQTD